jgi:putative transposase
LRTTWLANSAIADLVAEALHYRDGKHYRLDAYTIIPNHVHTGFAPLSEETSSVPLSAIMHSLKRNTAKQAKRLLKRSGYFWEHESFDHYIRNQTEFKRIIK